MPQLSQMIMAEPKSADFCGELLKFATAPFRAGRSLDGAIDELVALMQQKGDQPRPDDPATMQTKAQVQIEQMKIQAKKETDTADLKLKGAELQMKDSHKKLELQNQKEIKAMELGASAADVEERKAHLNLQMMHDREKHQREMIKSDTDLEMARQKADLAVQQHAMKADDMRARQSERQAAQQFKQAQQGMLPP